MPGSAQAEYLDLLCLGPGRTVVEFKYFTRRWSGTVGTPAEEYSLKSHAATDLARLGFVRDIRRLERFGQGLEQNGFAVMVTNGGRVVVGGGCVQEERAHASRHL